MARPRKWRKVCCLPKSSEFGPIQDEKSSEKIVFMTVDEYETIRLIDLEGLTQVECSEQMHVARTTVQGIYSKARKKIAEALVNGKTLKIEGGDYKLCRDNDDKPCGKHHCRKGQIHKNKHFYNYE